MQNNIDREPNANAREILRYAQDDSSLSTIPSPLVINSPSRYPLLLRRADQAILAMLALLALAAMAVWYFAQGGRQNRLIEIDQAQKRVVHFQVDINTADLPELIQLPGIGETLARRIVESRVTQGPFTRLDDLRRVRGIGRTIMETIRPYLLPLSEDKIEGN